MRIGCSEFCGCVTSCLKNAKNCIANTLIKCEEICNDPEALQKLILTTLSVFRGYNLYYNTDHFPRLVKILDSAQTLDFYGFLRLPAYFLYPYVPKNFNEYVLLDNLECILCDNWHLGIPDAQQNNRDPEVRLYAKQALETFLNQSVAYKKEFFSESDFHNSFQIFLEKNLTENRNLKFDPHMIDLRRLKIPMKPKTWITLLTETIYLLVDLVTVPVVLQQLSILNLGRFASRIGQIPLLAWVPGQILEEWLQGMLVCRHFVHFIQTIDILRNSQTTPAELKETKWVMAANIAEFIFNSTILFKIDLKVITLFAFFAKSLGLLSFLNVSEVTFFNKDANKRLQAQS